MDLKSLQDKQTAISSQFDVLTTEKKEYTDKISEIDTELVRLQGEHRLITNLIKELKEKKK